MELTAWVVTRDQEMFGGAFEVKKNPKMFCWRTKYSNEDTAYKSENGYSHHAKAF